MESKYKIGQLVETKEYGFCKIVGVLTRKSEIAYELSENGGKNEGTCVFVSEDGILNAFDPIGVPTKRTRKKKETQVEMPIPPAEKKTNS